jgi:hypothetical protein
VLDDLDRIELRQGGLGDVFQRLPGGIRQQMEVEAAHGDGLWVVGG